MTHPGIRCAVRDCDGTSTHELLTSQGDPFFDYDDTGLYICASHATDCDEHVCETRPIRVDDQGNPVVLS